MNLRSSQQHENQLECRHPACDGRNRMVFFVCNSCQETLKLKAIDIHRCHSTFCCVDCGKDFAYSVVRSHNSCISEAEKYEKTLYKGKGKVKIDPQVAWCEQIAAAAKVAVKHRSILLSLLPYPNVPRKAPKFINFSRNSIGVRDERILAEVFALIVAAGPPKPVQAPAATGSDAEPVAETPKAPAAAGAGVAAESKSSVSGVKRKRDEVAAPEDVLPVDETPSFSFKKTIQRLLKSSEDNKMKIKRLRKSVVEQAVSHGAYEDEDDAEDTFDSTFNKMVEKGKLRCDSAHKFVVCPPSAVVDEQS